MEALSYQTFPLPAGTEATRFTVKKMVGLIRAGIKSPLVRQKAVQVIKAGGARPYDQRAEVSALFSYVKRNFRFTKDPTLVELIHTPEKLLEVRSGDCDDFTVILSSLLGAVGYETRIAIVGPAAGIWSHAFPEVFLKGHWVALDATKTDPEQIRQAKKAGHYKTFSLQGGTMLGAPLTVKPSVVVDGGALYSGIVQEAIDYLNAELDAGRMRPSDLGRYFDVIPKDPTLTPLMKMAAEKGVELVGVYRFGYSRAQLVKMVIQAGPGELAFFGGVWKGIKKVVGTVVNTAKDALGIPSNQPVRVQIALPPPTEPPQQVEVLPGVTAGLKMPSTGEVAAARAGDFFSKNWPWLAGIGLAGVGLMVWRPWRSRRRG